MIKLLGIFIALLGLAVPVLAEEAKTEAPAKKAKVTEANFEDLLVQGKFHFSDEAVVTVEQDKVLDALLGVRKDFADRIEQSATKY